MRKKLIIWLFKKSQQLYTQYFKKNHIPWGITTQELTTYPKNSFGYKLGGFLSKHNFELISKVERHDAYHVLTQYSVNVEDEIALQWLCLGNGKKSPYMFGAIILGSIILPEYYTYYFSSFRIGKEANTFHHFEYKNLLLTDYNEFRSIIFSKELIEFMKTDLHKLKPTYANFNSKKILTHANI